MDTSRVRPAPNPPQRSLVQLGPPAPAVSSLGRFTVLTYNLLADLYAKVGGEGLRGAVIQPASRLV